MLVLLLAFGANAFGENPDPGRRPRWYEYSFPASGIRVSFPSPPARIAFRTIPGGKLNWPSLVTTSSGCRYRLSVLKIPDGSANISVLARRLFPKANFATSARPALINGLAGLRVTSVSPTGPRAVNQIVLYQDLAIWSAVEFPRSRPGTPDAERFLGSIALAAQTSRDKTPRTGRIKGGAGSLVPRAVVRVSEAPEPAPVTREQRERESCRQNLAAVAAAEREFQANDRFHGFAKLDDLWIYLRPLPRCPSEGSYRTGFTWKEQPISITGKRIPERTYVVQCSIDGHGVFALGIDDGKPLPDYAGKLRDLCRERMREIGRAQEIFKVRYRREHYTLDLSDLKPVLKELPECPCLGAYTATISTGFSRAENQQKVPPGGLVISCSASGHGVYAPGVDSE